jgi:hypothetical protein
MKHNANWINVKEFFIQNIQYKENVTYDQNKIDWLLELYILKYGIAVSTYTCIHRL